MGSPPPADAPSPEVQDATAAAASFASAVPTGPSICGLAIPGLPALPTFSLPSFDFGFPPTWLLPSLALKCDLSNPISADFGPGGGRVGVEDLEADPEG